MVRYYRLTLIKLKVFSVSNLKQNQPIAYFRVHKNKQRFQIEKKVILGLILCDLSADRGHF